MYNLHGNVVLVQRIYVCVRGRLCHKLMSATLEVMNTLPKVIQEYFPFFLTEKKRLYKNFSGLHRSTVITGSELSQNQRGHCFSFYQRILQTKRTFCSSDRGQASNEMLMNMFFKSFKARYHLYEEPFNCKSDHL